MTNPWAPDVSPAELWAEQTHYAALAIGAMAYGEHCDRYPYLTDQALSLPGIHIVVFFECAYYVLLDKKRQKWFWLAYIFLLFGCATVNICFNIYIGQLAWIDDRKYPGGPIAFMLEQQAGAFNDVAGNAVAFGSAFLADGLLVSFNFR